MPHSSNDDRNAFVVGAGGEPHLFHSSFQQVFGIGFQAAMPVGGFYESPLRVKGSERNEPPGGCSRIRLRDWVVLVILVTSVSFFDPEVTR